MSRPQLFTLPLLLVALAGCAAAPPRSPARPTEEPEGSADDYAARIERLEAELAIGLGHEPGGGRPDTESLTEPEALGEAPAGAPDCDAAPDLRDRICTLAERICTLATRDPADASLAQTCERARDACQRATDQVTRACGR